MCLQFTYLPCDDWENIYFVLLYFAYYHNRIGSMNYNPLYILNVYIFEKGRIF